jgi:hypothetical protein
MFSEDMPKIVAGYFELLDAVELHFKEAYVIERLSRQGELALVFKNAAGGSLLYVGVRWDLWSRMHLPLWLGVRPDWGQAAAHGFAARNQGRCFMHDGYSLCPADPAIAAGADTAPAALIALVQAELAAVQGSDK